MLKLAKLLKSFWGEFKFINNITIKCKIDHLPFGAWQDPLSMLIGRKLDIIHFGIFDYVAYKTCA
jgi:hypothetical protein